MKKTIPKQGGIPELGGMTADMVLLHHAIEAMCMQLQDKIMESGEVPEDNEFENPQDALDAGVSLDMVVAMGSLTMLQAYHDVVHDLMSAGEDQATLDLVESRLIKKLLMSHIPNVIKGAGEGHDIPQEAVDAVNKVLGRK